MGETKLYTLLGYTKDGDGKVEGAILYERDTRAITGVSLEKLSNSTEIVVENYDEKKLEPYGGWSRYTVVGNNGAVEKSIPAFVGYDTSDRGYHFVGVDGKESAFYTDLELALIDSSGYGFSNWFGIGSSGQIITYKEAVAKGEQYTPAKYALTGGFYDSKPKQRKTKSGERAPKSEKKVVNKLSEEKQKAVDAYNDCAQRMQFLALEHARVREMEEQLKEESALVQAQFNGSWELDNLQNRIVTEDENGNKLYGVTVQYHNKSAELLGEGLLLEPKYKYIRQFVSCSTKKWITVALTQDGHIELHDVKKGTKLTEYTGAYKYGEVMTLKIVDFLFANIGVTRDVLLVGLELPDVEDKNICLWCVVDIKTLTIIKTLGKMRPYGVLFRKSRVVDTRNISALDFVSRDGEYVAVSTKDYTYESRLMLGVNKEGVETTVEYEETPKWTIFHIDLTSGEISYSDSLSGGSRTAINKFTNVNTDTVAILSRFIGSGVTEPKEEKIRVRRHYEEHLVVQTGPITDYDLVTRMIEQLKKLESFSNILVWDSLATYANATSLDAMESLLDVNSFTELINSSDGTPIKGKLFALCVKSTTVILLGAFVRGNSNIQLYTDTYSLDNASSKQTFSGDREALKRLLDGQDSAIRLYGVNVKDSVQVDRVVKVPVKAPEAVIERYGSSATTLRNVTSNLRVTQLSVEFGGAEANIYLALYDGLSFRYSKEELEARPDDTTYKEISATGEDGVDMLDSQMFSTAERARIYTKVMNPNKPVLETSLVSTFKVTTG